jgi:hypothetical protein
MLYIIHVILPNKFLFLLFELKTFLFKIGTTEMILIFLKFFMDDICDINFQSNGRFCKIRIRYNVIHVLCTVKDLIKSFILDKTYI